MCERNREKDGVGENLRDVGEMEKEGKCECCHKPEAQSNSDNLPSATSPPKCEVQDTVQAWGKQAWAGQGPAARVRI